MYYCDKQKQKFVHLTIYLTIFPFCTLYYALNNTLLESINTSVYYSKVCLFEWYVLQDTKQKPVYILVNTLNIIKALSITYIVMIFELNTHFTSDTIHRMGPFCIKQ